MAHLFDDLSVVEQLSRRDEYEVEEIVDRKNTKTGLMYLVKWKGYDCC